MKIKRYKLLLIILLVVGCEETTEYEKVYGCTDPNAPNFDTDATIFDNSCDYNIYACADSNATNYNVNVTMTLTAPGCGMGPVIAEDAKNKMRDVPGVTEVDVELVWDPPWNQDMISEEGKMQLGLI